ncbi:MAG: NYN domain-containing protein [Oceanipulchritudo sp.]
MKQLLLVDACNLLHRIPGFRSRLDQGMELLAGQLLELLRPLHDLEQWELHLVVDGKGDSLRQSFHGDLTDLSILFTPAGQSADTVIERWILGLDDSWIIRVASEDRAIRHTTLARGGEPLSAPELLDWLGRVRDRFSRAQANRLRESDSSFGNRLEGLP